jgi:hypothetical protein
VWPIGAVPRYLPECANGEKLVARDPEGPAISLENHLAAR